MKNCPILKISDLPEPMNGKQGWPWTEESAWIQSVRPDNRKWPKISIVTPSFNQGTFIEETIRSVLLQGYPNLEYIVIDGGSKDQTIEILQKYDQWLSYWVSEPDDGQAHAIQKGLEKCTGDVFNWINSDDFLKPNALHSVGLAAGYGTYFAGAVNNFSDDGYSEVFSNISLGVEDFISKNREKYYFQQPGVFFELQKLKSIGINASLHYCFDLLLTFSYENRFGKPIFSDEIVASFRLHQNSKTVSSNLNFDKDRIEVLKLLEQDDHFASLHLSIKKNRKLRQSRYFIDTVLSESSNDSWKAILKHIASDPQANLSRYSMGGLRRAISQHWNNK